MQDIQTMLRALRRPALLIRAARFGQGGYQRSRDLRRILRRAEPPAPGAAAMALLEREAALEDARRAGAPGYTFAAHIEVLTALMGEARLLAARAAPAEASPQAKASGSSALRLATNASSASRTPSSSGGGA